MPAVIACKRVVIKYLPMCPYDVSFLQITSKKKWTKTILYINWSQHKDSFAHIQYFNALYCNRSFRKTSAWKRRVKLALCFPILSPITVHSIQYILYGVEKKNFLSSSISIRKRKVELRQEKLFEIKCCMYVRYCVLYIRVCATQIA